MKIDHERIHGWYKIDEITWTDSYEVGPGIHVYKNVLPKELNFLEKILDILENDPLFTWQPAYVGYGELMPEYRDCNDFKYKPGGLNKKINSELILEKIYLNMYHRQLQAVKDYTKIYNVGELKYWEAMNLVRYKPGQHFQEHTDHGFSYNCTVSLVAYLNDNYDGGELYFRLQDLMIKPEAGDLFIFPSNFMYPHRAMPVENGIKYSLVTMLDYSAKLHSPTIHENSNR